MKKRKKGKIRQFTNELQAEIKKNKNVFAVYIILRMLVIAVAIVSLVSGNIENFFLCILSLILFLLPAFVERKLKIDLPDALEIVVLLFIFAAEILGEISSFYVRVPHWDTMLHTINGFLFAAIGFAMVDVLNRSSRVKFNLSPFYLAVMAFCFSMTVGVLWEFFEFGMDILLNFDMQKDTVLNSITSVTFDVTASNKTVTFNDIVDTIVISADGTGYVFSDYDINGYVDLGIVDTMKDLIVNFIGAVVFSVVGFFYVKSRGSGKLARGFIPTLNDNDSNEVTE